MSESSLTLTRLQLKEHLGMFLSWSRTIADWTAENALDATRIIQAGERQFYAPVLKSQNPNAPPKSYVWSFLSPKLTLAMTTNATDLPDDFGGFLDTELAFTSAVTWPLTLVPIWRVLEKIQAGTSMPTGITQPLLGAVTPKVQAIAATGQRWQITVWPTPTSSISVTGRYRSNPLTISDDTYYPMGGEPHAETLLESVLAAAEEFMNDTAGVHRERFETLLAASVALDQRLHQQEAA